MSREVQVRFCEGPGGNFPGLLSSGDGPPPQLDRLLLPGSLAMENGHGFQAGMQEGCARCGKATGVATEVSLPLLTVLIPVHDRLACLVETLTCLQKCLTSEVEVVVVDDASADGTAATVAALFPECRVLRLPRRGGPSVARNAGLEIARGRYFLPLDSDCFVVSENFLWLLERLAQSPEDLHLLLPCRSWAEPGPVARTRPERVYSTQDILLKTYGEVVPILPLSTLKHHRLLYPTLFAGGEPLLLVEVSRHQDLYYVDRLILEYRTDVPMRISGVEYQLAHAADIADVFEAYLPYLEDSRNQALRRERARVLERVGIYRGLALTRRPAARRLLQAAATGRPSALLFLILIALVPGSVLRGLFRAVRWLQKCKLFSRTPGSAQTGPEQHPA